MQLSDLWQLSDEEIEKNLESQAYFTFENKYVEKLIHYGYENYKKMNFEYTLAYAKSLPDTTWIARMWISI